MNFQKILFPTDFSACSEEGLAFATALARDSDATMLIIHVEEPGETYEGEYFGVSEELRGRLQERLQRTRPTDPSVSHEHQYVAQGPPAKAITRIATEKGIDLIVMPTHGRKGLSHLLMGSVAEEVVRRARCPVVTFRPGTSPA